MNQVVKRIVIRLLIVISVIALVAFLTSSAFGLTKSNNVNSRDYAYEHYCDSIYEAHPNYYMDVIVETDEYQQYINQHGEWWNE